MNVAMTLRLSACVLSAVFFASLVSASAPDARAADQPPIVIGTTISESGAYAESAKYAFEGYQLYIKQQNAKGGWLGRQLQLKYYDDTSDPATAVAQYQRLIQQDHVNVIVGPYSSPITAAVANIAEQYKMPMISPEVGSAAPFKRGLKWIFQGQTQATTRFLVGPIEIAKANGYKRIAITGEDSSFPRSTAPVALDLAKDAGLEIVLDELYPHGASDYAAIAQKIKQANPDAVFGLSYFPDAVGLLRALKQANVSPKEMYLAIGGSESNFSKETGKDSDGVLSSTSWSSSLKTEGNLAFVKAFQATFHTDPEYHSANNFAALQLLGAAIASAKSLDNDKIREFMATKKIPTVVGTYEVDANGLQLGYETLTLQWQGGQQYVVWPARYAQRKPLLPFASWANR